MGNNSLDTNTCTYIFFARTGEKKKNYNSRGFSVYIRDEIPIGISVIHGETPDLFWVEMNKQFFHLEENIYIGFVYISPINSNINDSEHTAYEFLEKDISKLSLKSSILLLGDFNTRVSTMSDFIINDDGKHTPVPDTYISDEDERLDVRRSENTTVNEYGKKIMRLGTRKTGLSPPVFLY